METRLPSTTSPEPNPQPAAAERNGSAAPTAALAEAPNGNGSFDRLLNPEPTLALQPAVVNQAPAVIDAKPLALTIQQHRARRKGRIAALPKIHRDMVNRMLANGVPYKNIVGALERAGFLIKERNISNWATGGFLEWQLEQEVVTQNRLDQDHLVDNLRREDASELSEVGLQAAATRLSQLLVQKAANAEDVEANLGKFSQMVALLSGITRDLATLQKQRDEARRTLGPAHDVNRIKNDDEKTIREREDDYSYPEDAEERGLALPAEFPLLPPVPTSEKLQEEDEFRAKVRREQAMAMVRAMGQQAPSTPALALPSSNAQRPAHPSPALPAPGLKASTAKPTNGTVR